MPFDRRRAGQVLGKLGHFEVAHIGTYALPDEGCMMPVIGSLGCSSNELLDLGARSKELPLVGYAFERVCAI